jgi:hypothetical protein
VVVGVVGAVESKASAHKLLAYVAAVDLALSNIATIAASGSDASYWPLG